MITEDIKKTLSAYFENLTRHVELQVKRGDHSKRSELMAFLQQVASTSEQVSVVETDATTLRSPVSFYVSSAEQESGLQFSGIPGGHEFNSLILAILNVGGRAMKIDSAIKTIIEAIEQPLTFEIFVSLSCHNCPDVVQSMNEFALLNPNISVEMIDGGVFPELVKSRELQGVPAVFLNGELFASGKVDVSVLVEKLMQLAPKTATSVEHLPIQDVVVIGGGPAGVSSAIYSARKGLKVTLIADRIGGQVKDTVGIENLISVPSTTGPELTGQLMAHMQDYDITLREHLKVDTVINDDLKRVILSSGEEIYSRAIIVATGARWRELNVPGEKENIGRGVAYCPHCDGPFFKGKDVAVIGGGNSGIEAALDLAGITQSVTVFEFADTLRADSVLLEQAKKRDNIRIIASAATKLIESTDGKVNAIVYEDRNTGQEHRLELQGVFVQIGLVPNAQFMAEVVETTRHGEIIINEKCETSVPGIFAAGDVSTVPYKQIVIAMGEGAKASLSAFEYLIKHPLAEHDEAAVAA